MRTSLAFTLCFVFAACHADISSRVGSPVTIRVAAANSSAGDKEAADFVCTGTNDEMILNHAIGLLVKGGTVRLADGDYHIDAFANEGNSSIIFGYNGGRARTINIEGGTENKSYNTRFGVGIHVTERAFSTIRSNATYRVFYGTKKRPPAPGVFFSMTHVNNVNFSNFYLLLHNASKPVVGIDGSCFGNMYLHQLGIYTERYFQDRFLHVKPAPPVRGSIGVISVPSSNDEMSRIGYDFVNVGGMHTGFLFQGVDHLVMRSCSAARCCYGYRTFPGRAAKTLTMLNCCDEGNAHLPYFDGTGHLTAIDFNIERFNADYIPDSPEDTGPYAAEVRPGSWHGFVSYTLQGEAFGIVKFWKNGHGINFHTENLNHSHVKRPVHPEFLETYFDRDTNRTLTWNGTIWVDAMGNPADRPKVAAPYAPPPTRKDSYHLAIYGGTPAGISAAVQAKRMGLKAVVVEPSWRIGGLTTGGLGRTDIGDKRAFGGIALEFYAAVRKWYDDPKHWKNQTFAEYRPKIAKTIESVDTQAMWTFEPSAALAILEGWEKRYGLEIVRGARLDRGPGGVEKNAGRIVSFRTENGLVFRADAFIDATYEGDLMAAAAVSYTIGRESNATYGETLNGIQPQQGCHHFFHGVDPYVVKGDRSSGLLPGVEPYNPDEKMGDGDSRVQAYCFRMCLTDVPENRIPFEKPADYDEREYELLFRDYEQRAKHPELVKGYLVGIGWINSRMPCRKTDTNNRQGFSTDFIGQNWKWADGSYEEREKIFAAHLRYQKGLMWTLANHPRIPQEVRDEVSRWGLCKDEFLDRSSPGGGWQGQLYVREARRMIGEYVMTELDCRKRRIAPHPIAKGAYGMDSHHVRRRVGSDGFVQNEGDVEVSTGNGPYGIAYGAITPKRSECTNLLVPVCLSASHIAYGSIRMEPVFFTLGQAAGTAAAFAIADGVAVQDVDYGKLSARLSADGQIIN